MLSYGSLLFSKHIPTKDLKGIIVKIWNLASGYSRSLVNQICTIGDSESGDRQLFFSIEVLDEAMSNFR